MSATSSRSSRIESRSQNAFALLFDSRSSSKNLDRSLDVSSCSSGGPVSLTEVTPKSWKMKSMSVRNQISLAFIRLPSETTGRGGGFVPKGIPSFG